MVSQLFYFFLQKQSNIRQTDDILNETHVFVLDKKNYETMLRCLLFIV